uniref:MerR family transcriptional regulator n=1 Tax=Geobacter metallireducens TaxID=28232 RepID=A0A831XLG0_GEOME
MIAEYIDELKVAGFSLEEIKEIVMATVRVDVSPLRAVQDDMYLLKQVRALRAEFGSLKR